MTEMLFDPRLMKVPSILPSTEHELFTTLVLSVLVVEKAGENVARNVAAQNRITNAIFKSEDYSMEMKIALSYRFFRLPTVTAWSFKHLSGRPLRSLTQVEPMNKITVMYAVLNENFTWDIVHHMLTQNKAIKVDVKNTFVAELTDKVATREFIAQVMSIRKEANLDLAIIAGRARKAYDLDESVPDEWVERMLL
jgi:hypothetical protein